MKPERLKLRPIDRARRAGRLLTRRRILQMNPSNIRQWLRIGDVEKLEQVILEGQGHKLVGEHSTDPKVRAFIKTVPQYMNRIDMLHEAVLKGQLADIQALMDNKKLALSKDQSGVGLLHKSVYYGHKDIVEWLANQHPQAVNLKDHQGRTPLHYCGASPDPQGLWKILEQAGAEPAVTDQRGKTATYYKNHPNEIEMPDSNKYSGYLLRGSGGKGGLNITRSNIRIWIHDRDLARLEQIIWEGHGDKLLVETSNSPRVKRFLDAVPYIMGTIKEAHRAAVKNNLSTFQECTEAPVPPEILLSKDRNGLTPLHKAAGLGHKDIVKDILQRTPQAVTLTDREGRIPCHYAAAYRDEGAMFDLLLEAGSDEKYLDKKGRVPNYYRHHSNEIDHKTLKVIPDAPRTSSSVPLTWDWRMLRSFSPERTKKPTPEPEKPKTPPMLAPINMKSVTDDQIDQWVKIGDVQKLDDLVLEGKGKKILGKRSWNEDVRGFIKSVPSYMDRISKMHAAAGAGDLLEVSRFTDLNKRLVLARDEHGAQPLHKAALGGHTDVISHIKDMFPQGVRMQDMEGRTALHCAAMCDDVDKAHYNYEFLVDSGAPVDIKDSKGNLAEFYLTRQGGGDREVGRLIATGNTEQLAAMILNGEGERLLGHTSSNPEMQSFLDNVPHYLAKIQAVHDSASQGNLRDLQANLDRRKFACARDRLGATPLHKAVLFNHTEIVRYLGGRFPEALNEQDHAGRTPLHYAATMKDNGHYYNILLNLGANPSITDNRDHTAEYYMKNPDKLTHKDLLLEFGAPAQIADQALNNKVPGNTSGRRDVDNQTLASLERCYKLVHGAPDEFNSLLRKHLTRPIFDKLKTRLTRMDHSLLDVIRPGVKQPDAEIGVYIPDYESYVVFAELLEPIIRDCQDGAGPPHRHPRRIDYGDPNVFQDLDPSGKYILSTRIQCSRNLAAYPPPASLSRDQLESVEQELSLIFPMLAKAELKGTYHQLADVEDEDYEKLVESEFLFDDSDRFLRAAGIFDEWPHGRGAFFNEKMNLFAWINYEDHFRMFATQNNGKVNEIYGRLISAMREMDAEVQFKHDKVLGFLTASPANLGTTFRVSVVLHLPKLGKNFEKLEELCDSLHLHLEDISQQKPLFNEVYKKDIYEISNKSSIGTTEFEIMQTFYNNILNILHQEKNGLGSPFKGIFSNMFKKKQNVSDSVTNQFK